MLDLLAIKLLFDLEISVPKAVLIHRVKNLPLLEAYVPAYSGPAIHRKPVPMCTDVAINVPDKTFNLPLGCAGCPHPGVHHEQMGGNWNGCMQMLRSGGMDSSHQAYKMN